MLLTHKKPEPGAKAAAPPISLARPRAKKPKAATGSKTDLHNGDEADSPSNDEEQVLWAVGDESDDDDAGDEDEDVDHHQNPLNQRKIGSGSKSNLSRAEPPGEEGVGLIKNLDVDVDNVDLESGRHEARPSVTRRRSVSNSTQDDPFRDDEFGEWKGGRGT